VVEAVRVEGRRAVVAQQCQPPATATTSA
jgi:hypothetical protein